MNLVELYDIVIQAQSLNGVPLSNGHVYVYALGRTRLMDTWSDVAGESLNTNPVILDNAGQAKIYVSDAFDYTLVFTDEYDNEIFSVDKYLLSQGAHSHADVAVAPSESIAVSSYNVGEVTVYVPYLTGQLGKVYTGIDPIVVNNTEDKISANHVPLGVQDPLYFVQDDEEGCIIGFSGQTIPEDVMSESALGFENNKITGYNGSAFSAGNEYEEGSYVDITDNTISVTGLPNSADVQNIVDVATSGLMPSGDYLTKESADTLYAPTGNYLTGLPEDLVYTADIIGLATTAQLDEKLDKADSANFLLTSDSANFLLTSDSGKFYPMESNPSGYLTAHQSLAGYATEQWVEDKGYLTSVDIPESAVWNATTQTVSANSAQWAGGTANPQIPVTGINGIKISESGDKVVFEVSANYATEDWVTGQGYLTAETDWTNTITAASANAYNEATAAIPTGLATTGDLQTVSGEITALIPSTAGLATEDWVTAQGYLTTAYTPDFTYHDSAISAIDESAIYDTSAHTRINTLAGRINTLSSDKADVTALADYQTTAGMTAYMTTGDSAEFMTTAERSDYIPTGVSSEFYTTANTAGYISTIPDTYLQNTDLGITDNKVTAISGIVLSAGTELNFGYIEI